MPQDELDRKRFLIEKQERELHKVMVDHNHRVRFRERVMWAMVGFLVVMACTNGWLVFSSHISDPACWPPLPVNREGS
jgi:hypothetical protein